MFQSKPKILYVEDDIYLSYVTKDNLELKGYDITFCKDGKTAFETFSNNKFDLCILDVMLPEMDGFTLAQKIRESDKDIPIIFLSAKSLKEDRITGFTVGGDDYITKPFSIEELVLKIEVFLKRSKITKGIEIQSPVQKIGDYFFDSKNLLLKNKDETKRLTSREADLLKFFVLNANKVLKKEDILNEVWGDDSYFNSRSLDVFISRLRKYLKKDSNIRINNIHGIGFILAIS
ncbi:MAG: response regulator transcription factor [Bacteroidetes bacterium]|nr:response regulator transcription factor [Bacteroidota bacterium]MBL7103149.1 response regulator transcription factor [Bacteroidales bacterium]